MSKGRTLEDVVDADVDAVRRKAEKLIEKRELPKPEKPTGEQRFPANLSDVHEANLADLLSYWASQVSYARYLLSIVKSAYLKADAEYDMAFDKKYLQATDKHVTDKRHNTGGLRYVRNKRKKAVELQQHVTVLNGLVDGYERKYQAVNREITRRQHRHE